MFLNDSYYTKKISNIENDWMYYEHLGVLVAIYNQQDSVTISDDTPNCVNRKVKILAQKLEFYKS